MFDNVSFNLYKVIAVIVVLGIILSTENGIYVLLGIASSISIGICVGTVLSLFADVSVASYHQKDVTDE